VSWRIRLAAVGGTAAALAAGLAWWRAGTAGLEAALAGAAIAAAAQAAAVALLRPGMGAATPVFVRRWASGVAARGVSALVVVAVVLATRTTWPPLWTLVGYFGVLLTLLYTETRFLA